MKQIHIPLLTPCSSLCWLPLISNTAFCTQVRHLEGKVPGRMWKHCLQQWFSVGKWSLHDLSGSQILVTFMELHKLRSVSWAGHEQQAPK